MRLTITAFWVPIIAILSTNLIVTHLNLTKTPWEDQSPLVYRCGNRMQTLRDLPKVTQLVSHRTSIQAGSQIPHSTLPSFAINQVVRFWVLVRTLLIIYCVFSGKSRHLSGPQFHHITKKSHGPMSMFVPLPSPSLQVLDAGRERSAVCFQGKPD